MLCFSLCEKMDLEVHLTIIWAPHQSDKAQEDQVRAQMGVSTGVKREVTKKDGEEVLDRNTKETPGATEEPLETNGRDRKRSHRKMKSMTGTLHFLMVSISWIRK